MQKFDKALFKKEVENNARKLFRRELTELNEKEAFHAVAAAVQNQIIDDWIRTTKAAEEEDCKRVYYLSMEFLMGRALGNNLINLGIDKEVKERFLETFVQVAENFNTIFKELFKGGYADLTLETPNDILNTGIVIEASPPGKKLQNLSLLSGGEKSLTAISLLFAILKVKNPPFVVLDEVEAALDEENVNRFAKFLKVYSVDNQFLVITHRRGTMEAMDTLYGVTMQEKGISYILELELKDVIENFEENIK